MRWPAWLGHIHHGHDINHSHRFTSCLRPNLSERMMRWNGTCGKATHSTTGFNSYNGIGYARWLTSAVDDSAHSVFKWLNTIPVHRLFPESIFPLVHSDGSVVWNGHDHFHFHWPVGACCYTHWWDRVHWQAGSAAEQSEPPLWWLVSVLAAPELLGECGLQPLEGAECGRSPRMGGETLERERFTVYTK